MRFVMEKGVLHMAPQSTHPPVQTARECISVSLYSENRHLFIVRVSDRSNLLISILEKYVLFARKSLSGTQRAT